MCDVFQPRDQFVSRLIKKLKMDEGETNQSTVSPDVRKGMQDDGGGGDGSNDISDDDDVQDSWEALADDEVC